MIRDGFIEQYMEDEQGVMATTEPEVSAVPEFNFSEDLGGRNITDLALSPERPEVEPEPIDIEARVNALFDPLPATQTPMFPDGKKDKLDVIDIVDSKLLENEGASGDTATGVATGERGLTDNIYDAMKHKYGKGITQSEAIKYYLDEAYEGLSTIDGFTDSSKKLQASLLDAGYNLDYNKMRKYKGLGSELNKLKSGSGSEEDVMAQLLDTANIGGKTSKGLAKRRALGFNEHTTNPIVEVIQAKDGEISYVRADGSVIKYGKGKGAHSSSSPGSLAIMDTHKLTLPPMIATGGGVMGSPVRP